MEITQTSGRHSGPYNKQPRASEIAKVKEPGKKGVPPDDSMRREGLGFQNKAAKGKLKNTVSISRGGKELVEIYGGKNGGIRVTCPTLGRRIMWIHYAESGKTFGH